LTAAELSPSELQYRVAVRVAVLAGVFSAIVAALLGYEFLRRDAKHPAEQRAYLALKAAVAEQPDNEPLKAQFRTVDAGLRAEHFRHAAFAATAAGMLATGLAVFLIAAKVAAGLRRKLPLPGPMRGPCDPDAELSRVARWAVAGLGLAIVGGVVGLAVVYRAERLRDAAELAAGSGELPPPPPPKLGPDPIEPAGKPAQPQPETPPTAAEFAKAWPRFRGADGLGIAAYENIPTKWDADSGENIRWKAPVPLPGHNSPVVWGQRVFLSGADKQNREVYCFDADKGTLLWQREIAAMPGSPKDPPKVHEDTGYAAPTVATDGRRVYAMFANGDLAALNVDGSPAWSKSLGLPHNAYGHASSLCLYGRLLIVQFDQGDSREPKSKLLAFDAASGAPAWEAKRPVPNSWTTPIVIRVGQRDQIITAADPWVIAYDPKDGSEIWRAKCLKQDIGPSPVCADGVVYVATEYAYLSAIRADGSGDVTATHLLWKGEDNLPDTCCPLATKQFVFVVATHGILTCYDAKQGEMLWDKEFETNFVSSPTLVGKHLYLIGLEGKCWVVEPKADGAEIVAESNLGEKCVSSPALQDGRMYLRGEKHLICIGK